jgi:hypothetical protein
VGEPYLPQQKGLLEGLVVGVYADRRSRGANGHVLHSLYDGKRDLGAEQTASVGMKHDCLHQVPACTQRLHAPRTRPITHAPLRTGRAAFPWQTAVLRRHVQHRLHASADRVEASERGVY